PPARGPPFLFLKAPVAGPSPPATMFGRCLVASIALGAIMVARRGPGQAFRWLRDFGRAGIGLGIGSTALPVLLIAGGETRIDSGIAAIANASMPIFVVLLAIRFMPGERVTGRPPVRIACGVLGVR